MICHWDDAPWRTREHADLRFARQRLGAPREGAGATGAIKHVELAPGGRARTRRCCDGEQ